MLCGVFCPSSENKIFKGTNNNHQTPVKGEEQRGDGRQSCLTIRAHFSPRFSDKQLNNASSQAARGFLGEVRTS